MIADIGHVVNTIPSFGRPAEPKSQKKDSRGTR